jgi:hypothetical protein
MSGTIFMRAERETWNEEIRLSREAAERRFSPPPGFCPWGCGAADPERNPSWGWHELYDGEQPDGTCIWWQGAWWSPCECNLGSRWENGRQTIYVLAYPSDYDPNGNGNGAGHESP